MAGWQYYFLGAPGSAYASRLAKLSCELRAVVVGERRGPPAERARLGASGGALQVVHRIVYPVKGAEQPISTLQQALCLCVQVCVFVDVCGHVCVCVCKLQVCVWV